MNDYARGVLEATAYYMSLESKQIPGELKQIRDLVMAGSAADFKHRIKVL